MSVIAAALKHMLAAGLPHDRIVAAVAEMEAAIPKAESPEERRRRVSRESSARFRAKRGDEKASPNVTERHQPPHASGDEIASPVTENGHETSPPRARGLDKPLNVVPTGYAAAAVVAACAPEIDDWPSGSVSDQAKLLIEHVSSPWLDNHKSLALNTTVGRLAAWRRDGASWVNDVIPVVTSLCARRRAAVGSWKFFDDAIAQSIADNRAALEIPEAANLRRPDDRPNHNPNSAREDRLGRMLRGAVAAADG